MSLTEHSRTTDAPDAPDTLDAGSPAPATSKRPRLSAIGVSDWLAIGFLTLVAIAIAAPWIIAPGDPLGASPGNTLLAPSLQHPFGTDYLGRDLYTRVVHGAGRTLFASLIAVVIGLGVGSVLGLVAAYFGRGTDLVVSRFVDVLLSIPGLLLSMVVVVALGFGSINAAIAVGVASVATFARLMRSEVLRVRSLGFVEAAHHLGSSPGRVLLHHVLPNSYGPVVSMTAMQFGGSILWIAALSFLGYGAPPPLPEWGLLVAEGREYIASSPWLVLFPGAVVALTVVSISRVSGLIGASRSVNR
ncbi:ABC transporter permease [Agromyces intestinalis]|uniref:ABC transporter permease n=1 Tax=Agromyces intestinalis TaxID=2592652 RepID=A0A5C1YF84_9MICO|nr:ABC transporter permease [Agromyces intestinalis]QEO14724.1 ABC transporter permease [Agromyces intestinalis]